MPPSEDHLVPYDSPLAGLSRPGRLEDDARCLGLAGPATLGLASAVCQPCFSPEWAVRLIEAEPGVFSVLLTEPRERLWRGAGPDGGPVDRFEAAICPEVAAGVCGVWAAMLLGVRYPEAPRFGGDGVSYHLTCWGPPGHGILSGRTWSPSEESAPGRLVAVAECLREYARAVPSGRDVASERLRELLGWFRDKGVAWLSGR